MKYINTATETMGKWSIIRKTKDTFKDTKDFSEKNKTTWQKDPSNFINNYQQYSKAAAQHRYQS